MYREDSEGCGAQKYRGETRLNELTSFNPFPYSFSQKERSVLRDRRALLFLFSVLVSTHTA